MALNDSNAALDPTLQSDYDNLKTLHDVCVGCVRCDLAKTRTQVVFGDGPYVPPGQIGLMIVGEAPGEDEDKQGRPFVGRSGRLIESLLKQAGMSRDSIWITNVNKCRPVKIENGAYKNRAPSVKEQQACEIWRRNELLLLKPQIVLALGATAAKALGADKTFQITKDRGQWMSGPENTEMLVTFHPSYILRQFEPQLTEVKSTVLDDLKQVKARLDALRAGNAPLQAWQQSTDEGEGQQLSLF